MVFILLSILRIRQQYQENKINISWGIPPNSHQKKLGFLIWMILNC